jgi:hypothetical protein
MIKHFSVNRTKKDAAGRVWEYCDGDGSWSHGPHVIGCGGKNKNKWMIWGGPDSRCHEFETLTLAMNRCREVVANGSNESRK